MSRFHVYCLSASCVFMVGGGNCQDHLFNFNEQKISAFFKFSKTGELSLQFVNHSLNDISFRSNINYLIKTGLDGFPQDAAIQFRTSGKKPINLENQNKNGWIYPNLYNSKLDVEIVDGVLICNSGKNFHTSIIAKMGSMERPVNSKSAMRLIYSKLSMAHEFRVMWKIQIYENGIVLTKDIVSDWFQCDPILEELANEL